MVRFEPGDPVLLREVWGDLIWTARGSIVVQDEPDQLMFYTPNGIRLMRASRDGRALRLPQAPWDLQERTWTNGPILSIAWPGVAHAVLLLFHPDWRVRNWYVNMERPLERTALGFDTEDRLLDVVVEPDLTSWAWKDEDELAQAVTLGLFTEDEARELHEEGERAVRRLVAREPPFDRDWTAWRPDPAWPVPQLPPGWDAL